MREIKFRQAIIRKGKFECWHYWGFMSKGEFVSPSNEWVDGEPSQQFTGLKDKFGKEIYEGDILEITNQTSELKGSKVSVVFKEGCFCDGYYGWRLSQHKEYNLEIIGNIYETPALLNQSGKERGICQ